MNKTVERTIEVLDYFSKRNDEGGIGISQLSRDLSIPKSSISDILYSLLALGFLQYDNEQLKTFRIGNAAIKFGLSSLKKYSILEIARPFLEKLYYDCGFTVFAGVQTDDSVTFVEKIEGRAAVKFSDGIGSSKPLHLTAIGKALLASYDDDEILDIVGETCYDVRTRNSLASSRALLSDIHKIRQRGYSLENFEENEYTYGIAAPIFDHHGQVCLGIGISIFSSDISEDQIPDLIGAVCDTARQISRNLGATNYSYQNNGGDNRK